MSPSTHTTPRTGAPPRRGLATLLRPRGTGAAGAGLVLSVSVLAFACERGKAPTAATSTADRSTAAFADGSPTPPPAPEGRPRAAQNEAAAGVAGPALAKVAGATEPQSAGGAVRPAVVQSTPTGSMIVRTGYAGIEVDSLDSAIARVRTLAQRVGGFVANTTVQGGRDQLRSASLELKVPSDRFDDALGGLAPIGKVESVNVNAQDVGEEYVDVAARVENAHRLEARLIALLANRTGKLQEVLSVERELARVREEIERYEGRLRFLRSRVALSTLTVTVHERAPIIVPVAGDGPIVVAFREAWRNFVGFIAALIASLGVLIPLGTIAGGAFLLLRRWFPRRTTES